LDQYEEKPEWRFRPKEVEMLYYYEMEDRKKSAKALKELVDIILSSDFADGWKAQYMLETAALVSSFFDSFGMEYTLERITGFLSSSDTLNSQQRGEVQKRVKQLAGAARMLKKMANGNVQDVFKDEKSFMEALSDASEADQNEKDPDELEAPLDALSEFEANRARILENARKDSTAFLTALAVAISYRLAEDWSKAEELFSELDQIISKNPRMDSEAQLEIPDHLAAVYQNIGNYEKALEMCETHLRRLRQIPAKEQESLPAALSNLAHLQARLGKTEAFHETVRDFLAAMQAYGAAVERASGMPVEIFLVNLAHSHELLGESARARERFEEALPKLQSFLASKSGQKGTIENVVQFEMVRSWEQTALLGLAQIHQREGRAAESEKILEDMRPLLESRKNRHSTFHRAAMHCGALNALALGNRETARQRFESLAASQDAYMETVAALPEEDLLAWQEEFHDPSLAAAVLGDADLLEFLLRRKGLVYGLMVERRKLALASKNPALAKDWKNLAGLRSRLGQLSIAPETDPAEISALRSQIAEVERRLGKSRDQFNSMAKNADPLVPQIAAALPKRSCLVEFFQLRETPNGNGTVGAIVLAPDGRAKRVDFGEKTAMEAQVVAFRESIAEGNEEKLRRISNELSQELVAPLLAAMPEGTERLFVSPDGELNFLPFAVLPVSSDGPFLGETRTIAMLASGRDLLNAARPAHAKSVAIFANPAFEQFSGKAGAPASAPKPDEREGFRQIALPALPGTDTEAAHIEAAARLNGWQPIRFLQADANEGRLRQIEPPGILHLATHGFYLNSSAGSPGQRGMQPVPIAPRRAENKNGVNPMWASGVALAGAQKTFESWGEGRSTDSPNDGVLTAEEVAALNLDGTWLVALSACETGMGEARSGEGVLGLRRAFLMAGAQNLLMTLWPVNDEATAQFMEDFYKRSLAGGEAVDALAQAQRNWLGKLRSEKGLLVAVRDAGPFVLATTGRPKAVPFLSKPGKGQFLR
jgi:CHAT domain-containing protein